MIRLTVSNIGTMLRGQIVGLSVEDAESSEYARDLFERVISKRGLGPQFVHSDNGHPMRGLTLVAFLNMLDVKLSFSRPRVSDDNPFIESFFGTAKTHVTTILTNVGKSFISCQPPAGKKLQRKSLTLN